VVRDLTFILQRLNDRALFFCYPRGEMKGGKVKNKATKIEVYRSRRPYRVKRHREQVEEGKQGHPFHEEEYDRLLQFF